MKTSDAIAHVIRIAEQLTNNVDDRLREDATAWEIHDLVEKNNELMDELYEAVDDVRKARRENSHNSCAPCPSPPPSVPSASSVVEKK